MDATNTNQETTMAIISATHDTYTISLVDGRQETIDGSYQDALQYARDLTSQDIEIGHDGDLSEGGDKTLFWASEEDAENDDGARALGSIRSAMFDGGA